VVSGSEKNMKVNQTAAVPPVDLERQKSF
jgi:hypothetical protein